MPRFSVVIPVLNEAPEIEATLQALAAWRAAGDEILLVDGGSNDATVPLARPFVTQVITAPRGRAAQMNAGARESTGDCLVFLHADTRLPAGAREALLHVLESHEAPWGRFDVRLTGTHPLLRVVERLMNWRSRLSGIATGDQAIFVERTRFAAVGGFPSQALMEDIELSTRLRRLVPPCCLRLQVTTSSRRWEAQGVLRTILRMWLLRLRYFWGADPADLARAYARKPGGR